MTADDALSSLVDSVVVGSDGSANARGAVAWAAGHARLHGLPLVVLHVAPSMPIPTRTGVYSVLAQGPDFADRVWARAQRHLDEAVDGVRATHEDVAVEGRLVKGEPAEVLSRASGHARVLVLGATGASAVSRILLGGTVAAVVHHAGGQVVVVPDGAHDSGGPVVAGLDDATTSAEVASAAVREAGARGTSLLAVHVWDVGVSFPLTRVSDAEVGEVDSLVEDLLLELTAPATAAGVDVERIVRHGRPEDVLVDLSASSSLLVVGSRGRGGFPGLLLGSVSRSVLARSACPVLVVRS